MGTIVVHHSARNATTVVQRLDTNEWSIEELQAELQAVVDAIAIPTMFPISERKERIDIFGMRLTEVKEILQSVQKILDINCYEVTRGSIDPAVELEEVMREPTEIAQVHAFLVHMLKIERKILTSLSNMHQRYLGKLSLGLKHKIMQPWLDLEEELRFLNECVDQICIKITHNSDVRKYLVKTVSAHSDKVQGEPVAESAAGLEAWSSKPSAKSDTASPGAFLQHLLT